MTAQSPNLTCYVSTERPIFSPAERDAIVGQGSTLETSPNRDSLISFFEREAETEWIYQRILGAIQEPSRRFWHFAVDGFERAQFARYGPDQHYDWHMDLGSQGPAMYRKLSLSVQLSDPDSYAGGDLEFKLARGSEFGSRDRGTITIFPSYVLHRVNPVTEGQRCSLVLWVLGRAPFR